MGEPCRGGGASEDPGRAIARDWTVRDFGRGDIHAASWDGVESLAADNRASASCAPSKLRSVGDTFPDFQRNHVELFSPASLSTATGASPAAAQSRSNWSMVRDMRRTMTH